MIKNNTTDYTVYVVESCHFVHMKPPEVYTIHQYPLVTYVLKVIEEFLRRKRKGLWMFNIYKDKECVYRYSIISVEQSWKNAIKRHLVNPCKRFSVLVELIDHSALHITVESRKGRRHGKD